MHPVLLPLFTVFGHVLSCGQKTQVKAGDTCWGFWTKTGMTEAEFMQANDGISVQFDLSLPRSY
jgi:LysM repeat protein